MSDTQGQYRRLIAKWQRIAAALQSKSIDDLLSFRGEALGEKDWETLRHLDQCITQLDPNSIWAERVYFGTPFQSFRDKLEEIRAFPEEAWISGPIRPDVTFDPWFPKSEESTILHRLIVFLLRDWYRPFSIGAIFDCIYEGEFYDETTSNLRVRQQLSRLRLWLEEEEIPLKILMVDGNYILRLVRGGSVLMRKRQINLGKIGIYFERLPNVEDLSLTNSEWQQILKLSKRQVTYLFNQGLQENLIEREGTGRYVRYRYKGSLSSKTGDRKPY